MICTGVDGQPQSASADSAPADSTYLHDPYRIPKNVAVDNTDVYASSGPSIFGFPQLVWDALVYPVGQFAIYAEHAKLLQQYYSWFTNADGTIGIFPSLTLGGETGTGGGIRAFHTNLWRKGKILAGQYTYSGGRGQSDIATYVDPNVIGTGLHWILDVDYLRTRHDGASINAAHEEDESRIFRLDRIDLKSSLRSIRSSRNVRPIWDDPRRKIERGSRELPDGVIGPFVNDEFGDVFGTVSALTGEGYNYAELKEVADQVRNVLVGIEDAAKVEIKGAQEEHVFVQYNNARLADLGLSAFRLKDILSTQNILLPGGDINTGDERIILELSGNFESVEELRRTVISLPGRNDLVYLEDIAQVYRGYVDPPTEIVRSSNQPSSSASPCARAGTSSAWATTCGPALLDSRNATRSASNSTSSISSPASWKRRSTSSRPI